MDVNPPRVQLALLPTPFVPAPRLERALDVGPLFLKRDDLTGFGVAGNKARPLEFLLGAAVADGCDVFVAAGSPSSNFCAAAAMAARASGLACDLLYPGGPPSVPSPNIELARAAGARLLFDVVATRSELDDAVIEHAQVLRAEGRRPYTVPRGGATAVGGLGYAFAARDLAEQCNLAEVSPRTVVVATGSGGTQAGLVAGQVGFGLPWRLVGASVSRPVDGIAERILRTSRACAAALGLGEPTAEDVDVRDCRGAGFGVASAEDQVSSRLALQHEGLLLDDYYGAKAMTLFRVLLTAGAPTPAVFWHTGGVASALSALARGAA
jgi:D-cysteine desulfhydrase